MWEGFRNVSPPLVQGWCCFSGKKNKKKQKPVYVEALRRAYNLIHGHWYSILFVFLSFFFLVVVESSWNCYQTRLDDPLTCMHKVKSSHQVEVKESAAFIIRHQRRSLEPLVLKNPSSLMGFTETFLFLFLFFLIYFSWRLITLQYCSGFCHTLIWISHGFTWDGEGDGRGVQDGEHI